MGGVYIIQTQTIIACEWQKQPEFVKYHEVWHHYYFAILTEAQRKKYKKEYDRATYCFRDYSCNDVQEDFADAFAYAHLYKDTKNKDLLKRMRLVKFLTKTYGTKL